MEINLPGVVDEVTAAFNRYEKALNTNDVVTLDSLFWKSPQTLRYGIGEQLYGHDQIAAFRAGRDPGFVVQRDLLKLWIVHGRDFGTANCEFQVATAPPRPAGRAIPDARTPEGWRRGRARLAARRGDAHEKRSLRGQLLLLTRAPLARRQYAATGRRACRRLVEVTLHEGDARSIRA